MLLLLLSFTCLLPSHNEISLPSGNSMKTTCLPGNNQRSLGNFHRGISAPLYLKPRSVGMLRRVKTQLLQREELMSMKSLFTSKVIVVAQTILRCPLASLLQSNCCTDKKHFKFLPNICYIFSKPWLATKIKTSSKINNKYLLSSNSEALCCNSRGFKDV